MLPPSGYRKLLLIAIAMLSMQAWSIDYRFVQREGLQLYWQPGDKVGVTTGNVSYGTMEQLAFWTSSTSVSRSQTNLYAVGYSLKESTPYYSYSPYQWMEAFDARSIPCRYDSQTQNGNGDASSLAQCDYQMASAVTSSTACTFAYRHIGGVLRISFAAPAAMNVASLTVSTQQASLPTTAVMDIISQSVTLQDYATAMTLRTENISVAKGQQVVLYLACPAYDLSANMLSVSVTDDKGNAHQLATVMGPNIKAGYLYDMPLTQTPAATTAKTTQTNAQINTMLAAAGIAKPAAQVADIRIDDAYTPQFVQQTKKGDVNGDGDVDVLDAIAIVGYYTKGRTTELSPVVCDMNGDGDIDVLDAIEIVGRYTKGQK